MIEPIPYKTSELVINWKHVVSAQIQYTKWSIVQLEIVAHTGTVSSWHMTKEGAKSMLDNFRFYCSNREATDG